MNSYYQVSDQLWNEYIYLQYFVKFKQLKKGVDVIVSTPGRLIDLLFKDFLSLNTVSTLVIDEFDKMLDQSFWPQINFINSLLPGPEFCQRTLFSASFQPNVRSFVDQIFNHHSTEPCYELIKSCEDQINPDRKLRDYKLLIMGTLNKVKTQVIEEFIILQSEAAKEKWLVDNLRKLVTSGKVLIFINTKDRAHDIHKLIKQNLNLEVPFLYGDMFTYERHMILEDFRKDSDVLISTDVLGRGIDIEQIQYLIYSL